MGETPFRFVHHVEVRFRDLDVMGHAHHSLPLIFFEEARAAYWREVAGRARVEDIDYIMAEATVRYHARIRYPCRISVRLRTAQIGTKSLTMEYEARTEAGELVAEGRTVQVMYDYGAGRSIPVPEDVRARILAFEAGEPLPGG
ncbi:MAG TPA: thioesterase family protein [Longimicrobiales bacterium]|nr:thioesterase family protein [Longimicrobiales bacterium]